MPPSRPATWSDALLARWLGSDEPAVLTAAGTWTGDELLQRAGGAARWLEEIKAGPTIPALVDESPESIALACGATLSGRALAPLSTRLPASDLASAISGLDARQIVAAPSSVDLAQELARRTGAIVYDLEPTFDLAPVPNVSCRANDVAVIVHTSGTEGLPKPVFVRQQPLLARLAVYAAALGVQPGDRFCSASPFHHTAGITMALTALGVGMSVIPQHRFSVEGWRLADQLGMTVALLVPTMIDMLLSEHALGDARPHVLQYGAAPIHADTLREALAVLPDTRFVQIFGQTEVSPMTSLTHEDHVRGLEVPDLLLTVGRALPEVELQVAAPDGDGIGELAVRAAHAFVVDDDGWRRTGDLGSIDSSGYVRLRGRVNDRIVRGGENVYPVEVEQALASHAGVLEVAVVGVPDRRFGERIKAVVVPEPTATPPTPDELVAHALERIAHFKAPEIIELATSLPRNASGKVLRRQLADG
jgi:acyl-CoA synthetase (AMP-forming)/AMP-acid ligase II